MAQIIWAEPALQDLEEIADYIALDNPRAAQRLVRKALERVNHLPDFPELGTRPKEPAGTPYRKLTVKPLLLYYRIDGQKVFVVHVTRGERLFSLKRIKELDT